MKSLDTIVNQFKKNVDDKRTAVEKLEKELKYWGKSQEEIARIELQQSLQARDTTLPTLHEELRALKAKRDEQQQLADSLRRQAEIQGKHTNAHRAWLSEVSKTKDLDSQIKKTEELQKQTLLSSTPTKKC